MPAAPGCLRHAVELALRAPSLHNTQPWRWRIGGDDVELYADTDRHLAETDPDHRDLLISCGAALHHLRVALAGYGLAEQTVLFPDDEDRDHLATVRLVPGTPDRTEAALSGVIRRRRTDRRPYRTDPVAPAALAALRTRAQRYGVDLHPVLRSDVRAAVDAVLGEAADDQRRRPGYIAELLSWTRRYAGAHDGVPTGSRPGRMRRGPVTDPLLRFPPGRLVGPSIPTPDGGILLVLSTEADDRRSRLAAGEATSAVLLGATRSGLATAPLSQVLELPETRLRLARKALHIPDNPQMVVRVGHAPDDQELPETPRRPLDSVLLRPR